LGMTPQDRAKLPGQKQTGGSKNPFDDM